MNKLSKILSITTATLISMSLSSSVYAIGLNCNVATNSTCNPVKVLNCNSVNNSNFKILNNTCGNLNANTINNILANCGLSKSCNQNILGTSCNSNSCTQNNLVNSCAGGSCNQTAKPVKPTAKPATPVTKPTTPAPKPATSAVKPVANPTTQTSSNFSQYQQEVLNLVNAERAKAGLKPLKLNAELNKVATLKSQDMATKNYFSHTSPTYGSPFDMMSKFGISYRTAGENIAMGQRTPSEVMNGWMNSAGHRANILNGSFTDLGVGIAKDSNGRLYWTQSFIGK
ncbi:CAP domain-containing protein [Hathewaya massiliensis]|uniref:CAP domain-containing protein n=1 Tax=Hathewaya massiliensis TaxID=1964382 RepID=UPI001156F7E7|nr:CAP domain-containing protein [Hathewaya massiliensis]